MPVTSYDVVQDKLWSQLHELAVQLVNTSSEDEKNTCVREILEMIGILEIRYGRQPILLALRADYTVDPEEEQRLLKEAYSLASDQADEFCAYQSAVSLSRYYVERRFDAINGRYWLVRARECATAADQDAELDSVEELIAGLEASPDS